MEAIQKQDIDKWTRKVTDDFETRRDYVEPQEERIIPFRIWSGGSGPEIQITSTSRG